MALHGKNRLLCAVWLPKTPFGPPVMSFGPLQNIPLGPPLGCGHFHERPGSVPGPCSKIRPSRSYTARRDCGDAGRRFDPGNVAHISRPPPPNLIPAATRAASQRTQPLSLCSALTLHISLPDTTRYLSFLPLLQAFDRHSVSLITVYSVEFQ